jgi:hypothetical protein
MLQSLDIAWMKIKRVAHNLYGDRAYTITLGQHGQRLFEDDGRGKFFFNFTVTLNSPEPSHNVTN